MSAIPEFERLKQEDQELDQACLVYSVKSKTNRMNSILRCKYQNPYKDFHCHLLG